MEDGKVVYRKANLDDVPRIVELELKAWGEKMFADHDKWNARINTFPDGLRVAEKDNEIIGVVCTLVIDWNYPDGYFPTWAEVSGNGYISNHNINGDTLYGIDLCVLPGSYGVANRLVAFTRNLRIDLGKPSGGLGCRIPSLAAYVEKNEIPVVTKELVEELTRIDEHVDFWVKNDFSVVAAKEAYFPEDLGSLGWGIILKVSGSSEFWK